MEQGKIIFECDGEFRIIRIGASLLVEHNEVGDKDRTGKKRWRKYNGKQVGQIFQIMLEKLLKGKPPLMVDQHTRVLISPEDDCLYVEITTETDTVGDSVWRDAPTEEVIPALKAAIIQLTDEPSQRKKP